MEDINRKSQIRGVEDETGLSPLELGAPPPRRRGARLATACVSATTVNPTWGERQRGALNAMCAGYVYDELKSCKFAAGTITDRGLELRCAAGALVSRRDRKAARCVGSGSRGASERY